MNKPQILWEHQISNQTQIIDERQILKEPQIANYERTQYF